MDLYFDNVGGAVLAAMLRVINRGARIPLCGIISEYNATEAPAGPSLRPLLVHRAMIKGFIVSDHTDRAPAFLQVVRWSSPAASSIARTRRRLDNAPSAFIGLLEGRTSGSSWSAYRRTRRERDVTAENGASRTAGLPLARRISESAKAAPRSTRMGLKPGFAAPYSVALRQIFVGTRRLVDILTPPWTRHTSRRVSVSRLKWVPPWPRSTKAPSCLEG